MSGTAAVDLREDVETLTVENLSVAFGAVSALTDVSFTVEPGTIHAIIGPNGAGKSTLFNVLSGVYRATSGEVRLGTTCSTGCVRTRSPARRRARPFQNIALSITQTVADNLMLGRHGLTHAGFLVRGAALAEGDSGATAARAPRPRRSPSSSTSARSSTSPSVLLSYGDQKRVEAARALCTEPRLLLLDEPVAG